ncbi:MAG TPA: imelysin family protein [Chitinophagales bacterium]|nr:imelysin family protein [Chitinophagales bacterium]HRG85883.1 imelysin family protein [Chitinophagales bacterium]HRH54897.1 imelysin family protein [Chitinophagales bacterium]
MHTSQKIKLTSLVFIAALFGFSSCKDDNPTDINNYDFQPILGHLSQNVITETYIDLHAKSELLVDAVTTLQTDATTSNLEAARQAWRNTRKPWEQSEGFLFGPVSTNGIDPSIDSWPVNVVDLEAVLSSGAVLTKSYIDGLEGTLKGFHTIEFLLWGENGDKTIDAFTPREFEYLIATSQSLESDTYNLQNSWNPTGENFQYEIAMAGESGSMYISQKSAMQEIINGMIAIADEVANGKIYDPLSQLDITLEESRFSANSKEDFKDNIRSIQNLYDGKYLMDGSGISDFIISKDADLDAHIKAEIQASIDLIDAIPGTFTQAIFDNPAAIEAAQESVRHLQEELESEVKPLIDAI